ncbi:hypothetical protein [Candidatus Ichthyocystis hellenicum]|uniref:hypothetical protein n=1 Tax=Candidatus Ichthyocystis hellenicum TaxID=1561003 RepID=UPI000B83B04F|nr:hypothetical protein [Candidatus Ichthyocystis hellenicum]
MICKGEFVFSSDIAGMENHTSDETNSSSDDSLSLVGCESGDESDSTIFREEENLYSNDNSSQEGDSSCSNDALSHGVEVSSTGALQLYLAKNSGNERCRRVAVLCGDAPTRERGDFDLTEGLTDTISTDSNHTGRNSDFDLTRGLNGTYGLTEIDLGLVEINPRDEEKSVTIITGDNSRARKNKNSRLIKCCSHKYFMPTFMGIMCSILCFFLGIASIYLYHELSQ